MQAASRLLGFLASAAFATLAARRQIPEPLSLRFIGFPKPTFILPFLLFGFDF